MFSRFSFAVAIGLSMISHSAAVAQEGLAVDVLFGTGGNQLGMESGIYKSRFFLDSGYLEPPKLLHELNGAGWVTQSGTDLMYSTGSIEGEPSVVALNRKELVNSQPIGDGGSCFVTTDKTGKMLFSAQYGGGSIAVFPINEDGSIGPRSQLIEHEGGSKIVDGRQDSPHPHYISISPDNRFAFVPDLGLDQLVAYKIDMKEKKLIPNGRIDVEPGGGPRHMKFHPNGTYAFVVNELAMSVTTFRYDAASGEMKKLHTVETLTGQERAENSFNSASEIRVHPSGKMIVTANRGHDSLSVFKFDTETGKLTRTQLESVRGSWPRNFNFSPGGGYLLAAGSNSNTVAVFSVHADSATIRYRQQSSRFVPAPICVTFPGSSDDLRPTF